ncbi:hypothetical protein BsWGS_25416 [Bradybaena similaris]
MFEFQHSSGCDDLTQSLASLTGVLAEVKCNVNYIQQEWADLQAVISGTAHPQNLLTKDNVIVSKTSLHKMAAEMDQVKRLLPKLLNQALMTSASKLAQLEGESEKVKKERDEMKGEVIHWKNQLATAVADVQKEKAVQLELQVSVKDLTDHLSQQSEFSFSLGSVCCTLLWRLSRQEDCIHTIVSGSKSAEFLALVSSSVDSYLSTYMADQWPDPSTDEAAFILALCGTVTNIAASALGREHLASSPQGQAVIDTFLAFIKDAPLRKSGPMKSLMLMFLYNISINQKGMKYLCSKPGLIPMMCWHVTEETDIESRVNTLRVLHSLTSDETSIRIMHELKENLPLCQLQQLTTSPNKDIQDLSLDIIMDLRQLDNEQ